MERILSSVNSRRPFAWNVASADVWFREEIKLVFGIEVSLTTLLPVTNFGLVGLDGSGTKIQPTTYPTSSVTNLISLTLACAPLVRPLRTIPLRGNPKKSPLTLDARDVVSIFNMGDVDV